MKRGLTVIELIVVLASAAVAAAILLPVVHSLTHARVNICGSTCPTNLKRLGLGLVQYTQDADDRLPPASFGNAGRRGAPRGWVGALMPYVKSAQAFRCPKGTAAAGFTTYFFNRNLAGRAMRSLREPGALILLGDGNASTDANYSLRFLPPLWAQDASSPAQRHEGGAKYLMADGRVLSATPAHLEAGSPRFSP